MKYCDSMMFFCVHSRIRKSSKRSLKPKECGLKHSNLVECNDSIQGITVHSLCKLAAFVKFL